MTATVVHGGVQLPVDPAWVVVAPPNYAPMQKSVRTMWDLMRDVAIEAGTLVRPVRPSFEGDIRPIFERLSRLQWVNAGFAAAFGHGGPNHLAAPEWLARLSDPTPDRQELRLTIANQFRVFDRDAWAPGPWPWIYGDAMNLPPAQTPRENTALTDTQLHFLQQWAAGDFEADWHGAHFRADRTAIDVTPRQGLCMDRDPRPALLLEMCLADAFHPGCEMTWPMRTAGLYAEPFRVQQAPPGWEEPDYGPVLVGSDGGHAASRGTASGPQAPGGPHPLDGGALADRHRREPPLRLRPRATTPTSDPGRRACSTR